MTIVSLRRPDADDPTLLRRARRGDWRARRLFCRRHAPRVVELVDLLVDGETDRARLAAAVLTVVVADGIAGDDALVRCAVRVLAPAAGERGLARLTIALTDVDGRSEAEVAELLGRSAADVAGLRAFAYQELGAARPVSRECRGWPLAARRDRLTPRERDAANGHLMLCRACRGRLEEQRRTREKLLIRGGAVSAVVVADVVSLSLPAGGAVASGGIASVVLGKAGAVIVGAVAIAVAATSTGVAVTRHAPDRPATGPGGAPRQQPATGPDQRNAHSSDVSGSGTGTAGTTSVVPSPPSTSRSTTVTSVPTVGATPLPSVTVSIPVPTTLPTALPTLPLPTPAISVSVPALPTSTSLLGH